ncbi:MAG TPA: glycoside hydrolase family 32 protein [Aggregatilineales bacterium]|nr:glycoside hydrolase family 32 protein [Aggregatilineales bacterium]
MMGNTLTVRRKFAADPHRPRYHFLPPANWMNDPNGVIQWNGQYHLFYQYNPHGPLWGDMHWGHAVSQDLIHWTDLSVALAPTPGGPDEAGCFSGCAVNNGLPTLVYTGTRGTRQEIQTQCLATSQDNLLTWQKYAGNPVLSAVPAESGQAADFRDPFVWREDTSWYMAVGSRIKDVGGTVFLFRSPDLLDWEYLNPLLVGDINRNGVIWECPNLFKLGEHWVLIVSAHTGTKTGLVLYFVGSYDNYRFTPTYDGVLDYGNLYAPLTMVDSQNRRLLFGWLREARPIAEQQAAGWSGVQSVPRRLELDARGRLTMTPVAELEVIRGKHHHYDAVDLSGDIRLDVEGLALEIVAEFEPKPDGRCGITLACSADGKERLDLVYEACNQCLVVTRVSPDQNASLTTDAQEAPHELAPGEPLQIRVLFDGSVVEIIGNDRTSLVSRVYPSHADNNKVHLLGTHARLRSLDIWEMSSIW